MSSHDSDKKEEERASEQEGETVDHPPVSVFSLFSLPHNVAVYGALFAVQLIFAVNIVLVRYATRFTPSLVIIVLRELVCTAMLRGVSEYNSESITFHKKVNTVAPSYWKYFLIPGGLLGVCGHLFLVSFGIQSTNAVTATIFATSRPLFSALTILFLGLGRPSKLKYMAFALGLIGETIAVRPWEMTLKPGTEGATFTIGLIALGFSNVCYGMYLVCLKLALVAKVPLPFFLSRVFQVGFFGLCLIMLVVDSVTHVSGIHLINRPRGEETLGLALLNAPKEVWLIALWGGLIVSPVPYALNGFAIKYVSPITVALFSNIETPICTALAVVTLGESVGMHQAVGALFVSVAVIVAANDHTALANHLPPKLEAKLRQEEEQGAK